MPTTGRVGRPTPVQQDVADPVLCDYADIVAEPIESSAGSIWTAMVVDYPFHSFSHIGVYYGARDWPGKKQHVKGADFL